MENEELKTVTESLYKQNLELAVKNKTLSLLSKLYEISVLTLNTRDLAKKVTLAWSEAGKVQGLKVIDERNGQVVFNNGDQKEVINRLVSQYERIFGRASHEVCKEAAVSLVADLPPAEVPSSLK